MTPLPYQVLVVVDKNLGERLIELARDRPAWVIDTPVNRPFIERLWKERADTSHLNGITSFRCSPSDSPEDIFISELGTIELHHGEDSASPPYSEIKVMGLVLTPEVQQALSEFDFPIIEVTHDGFIAKRKA
ncbi:hypothetical protein BH11VER1_BH11VER1_10020 [soil metagenome]